MRLYMFEHCSLCFRVRMIAALKRMHLQETVVLDEIFRQLRLRRWRLRGETTILQLAKGGGINTASGS